MTPLSRACVVRAAHSIVRQKCVESLMKGRFALVKRAFELSRVNQIFRTTYVAGNYSTASKRSHIVIVVIVIIINIIVITTSASNCSVKIT